MGREGERLRMSIEQMVREGVERANWECAKAIFDGEDVSITDTVTQALLSRFDITEKGRVEKMERVVAAARKDHWGLDAKSCPFMECPICEALKDMEGC